MIEIVTFALAMAGFALLAVNARIAATGFRHRGWLVLASLVVFAHVYLVWAFRYEWSFGQATRNGYGGFVLFHAALVALGASNLVRSRASRWCVLSAFLVVCVGANGAVWRYDEVAIYRAPVIVVTILGAYFAVRAFGQRRTGGPSHD